METVINNEDISIIDVAFRVGVAIGLIVVAIFVMSVVIRSTYDNAPAICATSDWYTVVNYPQYDPGLPIGCVMFPIMVLIVFAYMAWPEKGDE